MNQPILCKMPVSRAAREQQPGELLDPQWTFCISEKKFLVVLTTEVLGSLLLQHKIAYIAWYK